MAKLRIDVAGCSVAAMVVALSLSVSTSRAAEELPERVRWQNPLVKQGYLGSPLVEVSKFAAVGPHGASVVEFSHLGFADFRRH